MTYTVLSGTLNSSIPYRYVATSESPKV